MPVPGDAVDEDLASFELAGDVEADESGDEGGDAEEEMDGVDAGDEIEEMAALVGAEEDSLAGELAPCCPLAGEKSRPRATVAESQGSAPRVMGLPMPSHSSMTSVSRNILRRAISMARELSRRTAVLSQRMGGMAVGTQVLM